MVVPLAPWLQKATTAQHGRGQEGTRCWVPAGCIGGQVQGGLTRSEEAMSEE